VGYKEICIVEHVTNESTFVKAFLEEVEHLRCKYSSQLKISTAIEAKVVDLKGNLDLPEEVEGVDYIYGAFHKIPKGENVFLPTSQFPYIKEEALTLWFEGFRNLLKNPIPQVIAHPGAILTEKDINIPENMVTTLIQESGDKIFEINLRHRAPLGKFLEEVKRRGKFFYGSDSHSKEEIRFWGNILL
jgi:histidinol phosphatase-like PHP family hydrolase